MSNTAITPNVGAVRFTSNLSPQLGSASLALSGGIPGFSWMIQVPVQGNNVTPALALGSAGPILKELDFISSAALALASSPPSLNLNASAITPSSASVLTDSLAPLLALGSLQPSPSSIVYASDPPSFSVPNRSLQIPPGSLQFSGAFAQLSGQIQPNNAALVLAGSSGVLDTSITFGSAQTGGLGLTSQTTSVGGGLIPGSGNLLLTTPKVSPLIQPSAVAVGLIGGIPSRSGPTVMSPVAGSVVLVGNPGQDALTVPAPPTANLVCGGYFASLLLNTLISPAPASELLVGGVSGGTQHSSVISPQPSASRFTGLGGLLGVNLLSAGRELILGALIPGVSVSTVMTPLTAALMASGAPSILTPGNSFAPSIGPLLLTGTSPAASLGTLRAPVSASATFSASALNLSLGLSPLNSSLGLAGAAPTVNGRAQLAIPGATLSLLGGSGAQALSNLISGGATSFSGYGPGITLTLAPASGRLVETSEAPSLNQQGLPHPLTGALLWSAYQPLTGIGARVPGGEILFSGSVSFVDSLTTLSPTTVSLQTSSDPSTVDNTGVILPPNALLTFSSDPISAVRSGFISPPPASLEFNGEPPATTLTLVGLCNPGAAALQLTGSPTVLPLYSTDPYYRVALPAGLFIVQLPPGGE